MNHWLTRGGDAWVPEEPRRSLHTGSGSLGFDQRSHGRLEPDTARSALRVSNANLWRPAKTAHPTAHPKTCFSCATVLFLRKYSSCNQQLAKFSLLHTQEVRGSSPCAPTISISSLRCSTKVIYGASAFLAGTLQSPRECQLICVNCLSLVNCHGYGRCRMPAEAGGRSGATSPGAGWHPVRPKLPGRPVAARGRSSQIAASPPANPAPPASASRHSAAPNTTA